jgi:hypothetical protein
LVSFVIFWVGNHEEKSLSFTGLRIPVRVYVIPLLFEIKSKFKKMIVNGNCIIKF